MILEMVAAVMLVMLLLALVVKGRYRMLAHRHCFHRPLFRRQTNKHENMMVAKKKTEALPRKLHKGPEEGRRNKEEESRREGKG